MKKLVEHVSAKLLAALIVAGAARAHAGGFEILDQSPSGTGMAGAVAAKADDPSAIFYNPAGIALRDGDGVQLGGTVAFTSFSSRAPDGTVTSTTGGTVFLPQVYGATHIGDRAAIGLALFPQFGAGVKWQSSSEAPFPGRFVASNTQLTTVTINPVVAARPHPRLGVAVGLDVVLAGVELDRSLRLGDAEGAVQLGGQAQGVGFNAGVIVDVVPRRLSAAIAWRSSVGLTFDGMQAHFDAPPELKSTLYDQPAKTSLTLPHNFTFGLAFFPTQGLAITTDVHLTLWSSLSTIDVTFPNGSTPGFSTVESWRDAWSARVGGEYVHALGPGRVAVRAGFGYDLTPVPSETLGPAAPLADRLIVAGGLGYSFRGFTLAAAYVAGLATRFSSTNPDFAATYRGNVSALSFALSYQWGKSR